MAGVPPCGGLPVVTELAFAVNLLGDGTVAHKAKALSYLTRESFKHRQIDGLWQARRATSPETLGKVLKSEPVLAASRRELWRETSHGLKPVELLGLLRRHAAARGLPSRVIAVEAVPRTGSGKALRAQLLALLDEEPG